MVTEERFPREIEITRDSKGGAWPVGETEILKLSDSRSEVVKNLL